MADDLSSLLQSLRDQSASSTLAPVNGQWDSLYANALAKATSPTFGVTPKQSDEEALYWKALDSLGAVGKLVTNQLANWTDGSFDWKDNPFAESLTQGWDSQLSTWKDGKLSWGDVPGFGLMYGIGHDGKGFSSTLENLGIQKGSAAARWGGLAGDIVLDPVNFLTGGIAAATKAGKGARIAEAGKIASELGLDASKGALKSADAMAGLAKDSYVNDLLKVSNGPITPQMDSIATQRGQEIMDQIMNAGKQAQLPYQDKLLAWNIPGTTAVSGGFGSMPNFLSFLKPTATTIGTVGGAKAGQILQDLGLDGREATNLLKERYGVGSVADLTTDQFSDLKGLVGDLNQAKSASTFVPGRVEYNPFNLDQALQGNSGADWVKNILDHYGLSTINQISGEAPDILRDVASKMGDLPGRLKNPGVPTDIAKAADVLGQADNTANWIDDMDLFGQVSNLGSDIAKSAAAYVPDITGGKNALQRWLATKNPFDARTNRSLDQFINNAANYKADAQTLSRSMQRTYDVQLNGITKAMNNMTDAEKKAVIYQIEGQAPKGFDVASVNQDKVNAVASQVKDFLSTIGQNDLQAGTVKNLIDNYFPHVMGMDDETLKTIINNPSNSTLTGKSMANQFNQERTGFKNLASWEDAMAGLEKEAAAGNTDAADALDQLKGLYETDITKALGQRAYKSSRSVAFKDMYDKLESDGLLYTPEKAATVTGNPSTYADFKRLSGADAKAAGLPEGTYVHKDVLEGMTDMKELFTDKGMNNLMRTWTAANSIFKSMVTLTPAHYVNNLLGNVAVNTMAGVTAKDYAKAGKLLGELKEGGQLSSILDKAVKKGVISQGFHSDFVKSPFADIAKENQMAIEKVAGAMNNIPLVSKAAHKSGEVVDNFSRLALFINRMERYDDVEKAAADVRKYLFNYTEMTSADRHMRNAIPFWNWTKNNIPLQIKMLFQNQGGFQAVNKVRNELNKDVQNDKNPSWTTDDYLHIPGTSKGIRMGLPMNDLGLLGNPLKGLLNSLSPYIKDTFELGMNRKVFNGSPVYDAKGSQSEIAGDLAKYFINQTGMAGRFYKAAEDASNDKFNLADFLATLLKGSPVTYK